MTIVPQMIMYLEAQCDKCGDSNRTLDSDPYDETEIALLKRIEADGWETTYRPGCDPEHVCSRCLQLAQLVPGLP